MIKIIKVLLNILGTNLKLIVISFFPKRTIKFSLLNNISLFCEIDIAKKGILILNKKITVRKNSCIGVREYAKIEIGSGFFMNEGGSIIAHEKISIGDNVIIGPNVHIYDHDHEYKGKDGLQRKRFVKKEVVIGNNVWIGANVVILKGTVIGDNVVIGAGCVVKGKIEDDSLCYLTGVSVKKISRK